MRAEALITLAAAHGVDLVRVAKSAAPVKGRKNSASKRLRHCLVNPVFGRESAPAYLRPEWTVAEIGQAAAGLTEVEFMAACFVFAGERGNYWRLHERLLTVALRARRRNGWSWRMPSIDGRQLPYLEHLAQLVLDEDAFPSFFVAWPGLYAVYMQVDDKTWAKPLAARYDDIKLVWQDWIASALRSIQAQLSEDVEAVA